MERKVKVYDFNNTYEWQFTHNPNADTAQLKELTKQCHIAQHPDCEYSMSVDVSGREYYMTTDGDDDVVMVSMLCILLEDKMLKTILAAVDCGFDFFQFCIPPYEPVNKMDEK